MDDSNEMNERVGRMADILEQLQDLKKLIALHSVHDNHFMKDQYEYRRKILLKELRDILMEYEVTISELAA